ncbi:DUF2254 domain-containing protein [Smaragdicoccus niigatensis]|uniref:DUF2254 domain-containing protein n=1 Tax=Smaragdicoccus niigatensis TaxID=359359 RepID=UPI000477E369|nr:DUF2254 domain-containing protein [Smaragdicoccus niigatensis]
MARSGWDHRREQLAGALWVIPVLFAIVALISGWALSYVEEPKAGWIKPFIYQGSAEEARRLLLTLATSIVGVLALVIGLSMVGLQMAANRYSPRLLRNYLRDRPAQFTLGVFVGAFTYNAAGLFTVGGDTSAEYPRLAVTVGLGSLFVCIAALVYYVDHMMHSIQLDRVLAKIGIATAKTIERHPPGIGRNSGRETIAIPRPDDATRLVSPHYGYLQAVYVDQIVTAAAARGLTVELAAGIGDHVISGSTLGWVWDSKQTGGAVANLLTRSPENYVRIGFERTMHQDVSVGLIQIVDISLRSMHDFDYNTSIQAANELGILLSKLGELPLGPEVFRDDNNIARLIVPAPRFADYLDLACGQIRRRGAGEPVVLKAVLTMLHQVGAVVTDSGRKATIGSNIEAVVATVERSVSEKSDKKQVERLFDHEDSGFTA